MFVTALLSALVFSYGYVTWRFLRPARLPRGARIAVWLSVSLLLVLPPLALVSRFSGATGFFVDAMAWVGFASLGFFSLLFFLVLAKDLAWAGAWTARKVMDALRDRDAPPPPDPERRRFLANGVNLGLLAAAGGLSGAGLFQAHRTPPVRTVTVPLARLPRGFEGFRLVQLTDLHVGPTIGRGFVEDVVEAALARRPDCIVVTGDLVDGTVSALAKDVEPLGRLQAPWGVFFVTGNHEYYAGVDAWIEHLETLGLTVLTNEHRILNREGSRLCLAGVTDFSSGRFGYPSDPARAFRDAEKGLCRLLLAHQPRSIYGAAEAGCDLVLSGHTHGGQYLPWPPLVRLGNPYVRGLHKHEDTFIYVCPGAGYWGPPNRLGVSSEIAEIVLARSG